MMLIPGKPRYKLVLSLKESFLLCNCHYITAIVKCLID